MLKQYHTVVVCRKDGKEKEFYYTMVEEKKKKPRPGLRWGCNEKSGCEACRACWMEVKRKIV